MELERRIKLFFISPFKEFSHGGWRERTLGLRTKWGWEKFSREKLLIPKTNMTAWLLEKRGDLAVPLESNLQVYAVFPFLVSSSSSMPCLLKSCSPQWSSASVRKHHQQLTEASLRLSFLCSVCPALGEWRSAMGRNKKQNSLSWEHWMT